jgi:hypothetical protein
MRRRHCSNIALGLASPARGSVAIREVAANSVWYFCDPRDSRRYAPQVETLRAEMAANQAVNDQTLFETTLTPPRIDDEALRQH